MVFLCKTTTIIVPALSNSLTRRSKATRKFRSKRRKIEEKVKPIEEEQQQKSDQTNEEIQIERSQIDERVKFTMEVLHRNRIILQAIGVCRCPNNTPLIKSIQHIGCGIFIVILFACATISCLTYITKNIEVDVEGKLQALCRKREKNPSISHHITEFSLRYIIFLFTYIHVRCYYIGSIYYGTRHGGGNAKIK